MKTPSNPSAMEALAIMCDHDYNLSLWCSSVEAPDMRFYAWSKKLGPLCRANDATLEGAILKLYGIYEQAMKKAALPELVCPKCNGTLESRESIRDRTMLECGHCNAAAVGDTPQKALSKLRAHFRMP